MTTSAISNNLQIVHQRIEQACRKAKRSIHEVRLLAVSKTFTAQDIAIAHECGQNAFGENYIHEGLSKIESLRDTDKKKLEWHCIGPIQSNKSRSVAENFDWVQTVDRLKIAQRLAEQRPAVLPPLNVLIQVNADAGINKSGVTPKETVALAFTIAKLQNLTLRGLMSIPEPHENFEDQLQVHQSIKILHDRVRQNLVEKMPEQAMQFDTLSLGMTADLEAAIMAGSTMVRVGSGIFGHRDYTQAQQDPT